jgi:hypothetical protein
VSKIKENRKECMLIRGVFHGRIGERRWEKKIQRKGGKCRGEETDGMDRKKWMGSIEWEKTREEERESIYIGSRGETVIVNEEAWERVEELDRE